MKKLTISVVAFFAVSSSIVHGQLTRVESTNQLSRVVYSGSFTNFPSILVPMSGVYNFYNAVIPIPEIKVATMPSIEFWGYSPASSYSPAGWMGTSYPPTVADGQIYIPWKMGYSDGSQKVFFTDFKLVITYDPKSAVQIQAPKLTPAFNGGTAKLVFDSVQGQNYTVESRRGFDTATPWTAFTNLVGTGTTITVTDTNGGPQRFYRTKSTQ